jgi:hypothetical protein
MTVLSPGDNPKVADLGPNITVDDKKLVSDQSAVMVVASDLLSPSRAEVRSNITVDDKKLVSDQSAVMVVASDLLSPSRAEVTRGRLLVFNLLVFVPS